MDKDYKKIIREFFRQYDERIIKSWYYRVTTNSVIYRPDGKDYVIGYSLHLGKRKILELQKERLNFEILDEFSIDDITAFSYRMKKLKELTDAHKDFIKKHFLSLLYRLDDGDDYRSLEYLRPFVNSEFNRIIDLVIQAKPNSVDLHIGQFMLDSNNDIVVIDCEYNEYTARKIEKVAIWYDNRMRGK